MYKKFKRWLKDVFKFISYEEVTSIELQYKELINKIHTARTLSDFINANLYLREFKKNVERLGNPPWATIKLQTATRYWYKRYKVWKFRG
jgi:hypothetical protein